MKIVTAVVNNPDFIEIQYWTLKEHFKGEYEYIVFNDAKDFPDFTNGGDVEIRKEIENVCKRLNIKCINVKNNHHKSLDMSNRHADTFNNNVLKYQKENPDKYLLLDSDMFLIDDIEEDRYSEYDIAMVLQKRRNEGYIWPGLCYFDMGKMKNFELINWSLIPGFDSGGMTKEWLKKQMGGKELPDTKKIRCSEEKYHINDIYFIKHLSSCSWIIEELPKKLKKKIELIKYLKEDSRNKDGKIFCEIYDEVYLHYRAGGNWMGEGMELHKKLTKKLKETLLKKD